jgi:GTP cyclohydrolase I
MTNLRDEIAPMMTRTSRIAAAVEVILEELGYDGTDPHFLKTPERYATALLGFQKNGDDTEAAKLLSAVFDDEHDSLVIVGPTRVTSMCAHHMLPVTGNAFVGYIPDGRVVGLSKLSRIVDFYARQFTVQERVTQQIVEILMTTLEPKGAICVIDAEHGCMRLRGVQEPNAITTTSAIRGVFYDDASAKEEFLRLIEIRR